MVIQFLDVAFFPKKYAHKSYDQDEKSPISQILHPKKLQTVLMKINEMSNVFLNSANFWQHAFVTLAPPSSYTLNLFTEQESFLPRKHLPKARGF